ncbi:MAG: Fe-S cluster assembly protein SufD [Nitrososphaeraceae archaeon]
MATLSSVSLDDVEAIARENSEPHWLLQMRRDAFADYSSLPAEVSPLYSKYSDVNRLRPQNIYLPDKNETHKPFKELSDRLKEVEEGSSVLRIGSNINEILLSNTHSKDGIIVTDLNNGLKMFEDKIKQVLTTNRLDFIEDKFLALEASIFRGGLFVYIPKNLSVSHPIRLINSLSDNGNSSVSRNIVLVDSGSRATIVQEMYSPTLTSGLEKQQAYFELLECNIGQNASLEMVTLQAMDSRSVNFSNRKAFVERDGRISWYSGMFGSQLSRYKIDSIMKGPGSVAEDVEIIFGIGDQSFDVTSNLIHEGNNSRGRVLVKSVMKDFSKSLFKGMIKIGKGAKGSESYLAGHAILLDKGAKSDAIPGLEIETNEVKATHSASVAQLDESQIFYLMSRGLNLESAKREIVNGFLEPLSRKMGSGIRAWINYLIENKWTGKSLMLRTDEVMAQILEVEKSRYHETQDIFEKHYKYR